MPLIRHLLPLLLCLLSSATLTADELPPRAVARLGDYRFFHGGSIDCAAISHDGRRVATASNPPFFDTGSVEQSHTVVLWDAITGGELRRWQPTEGTICNLIFSLDGKQLLVGVAGKEKTANAVLAYDCETGKLLRALDKFQKPVVRIQYSLDGKHLHVSEGEGAVTSWDAVTGKKLRTWEPKPKPARASDAVQTEWDVQVGVLSPDEKVLLWCLWRHDRYTEKEKEQLCQVGGGQYIVRGYDAGTNKELYEVLNADFGLYNLGRVSGQILPQPHTGPFSRDGKRIAVHGDPFFTRDALTGKVLHEPQGDDYDWPLNAAWSPDGKRAAVNHRSGRLRLWNLETGKVLVEMPRQPSEVFELSYLSVFEMSADGQTLLAATATTVRIYDLTTGKERRLSPGHRQPVQSVWFSPDSKKLVSRCVESVCEWDVALAKEHSRFDAYLPTKEERLHGTSPDSRFVIVEDRPALRMREVSSGKVVRTFEKRAFKNTDGGVFSPGGDKVAVLSSSEGAGVEWFDTTTGKRLGKVAKANRLGPVVFSPDGRLLTWATDEQTVVLVDAVSGRIRKQLDVVGLPSEYSKWSYHLLSFSSDSEYLVAAAPNTELHHLLKSGGFDFLKPAPIQVFHVQTGKEIARFFIHPEDEGKSDAAIAVNLSPDGRLLAIAEQCRREVRLVEIASGRTRLILSGHRDPPKTLAFSPDGKTLASGGEDNLVYLWDVTGARTGAPVKNASDKDLAAWWTDLASEDAKRAGDSLASLIRTPSQSVAYLKEQVHPIESLDEKRLARLLADLDADAFEKREAASRELTQLDERAEPALRRALKAGPQPEAKRRMEELLERLEMRPLPPETLQALRAIEALEHIGTPEAQRLLKKLADGDPEARLTRDAKASLKRLTR